MIPPDLSIIFIHKGNSWYLPYTLWQCKKTNQNAAIYLIGDPQTSHLNGMVKYVDIKKYESQIEEIRSVYKHHSSLNAEFELTCIERWFILLAFLKENNIERCVYLDSDILVYKDLNPYAGKFSTHDMTWCSFSAHSNFVNSIVALENYCNNVIDLYADRFPNELKEKSLYYQVLSGKVNMNISDMTFFHDYNIRYADSLLAINNPNTEGTFDISMEETRVFEADGFGFKQILWKNKIPCAKVKATGEWVSFVTLHFQGKAKQVLKNHFVYPSIKFQSFKLYNDFFILYHKLRNKLIPSL
jgi:hypothetical protein